MKTSELQGAALDWAVAKCEPNPEHVTHKDGVIRRQPVQYEYAPSTDWGLCGEIIEREDISFRKYHRPDSEAHGKYYARICRESGTMIGWYKTTGHALLCRQQAGRHR